ncbi:MAG: galactokinase [Promethearchaeia archaeon]
MNLIAIDKWLTTNKGREILESHLLQTYGKNYNKIKDKLSFIQSLLELHKTAYGNQNCSIIRVPGRINLMGRHVDHQGGVLNLMAIDREMIFIASSRNDHKINVQNYKSKKFPAIQFLTKINPNILRIPWKKIIENQELLKSLRESLGSWINYLKGAFYKIGNHFKNQSLKGGDITIGGNIPIAAGLSSSSALTIGMVRVLMQMNNFHMPKQELINLAAEAEWFVGTRGGAGDHAAILLSEQNKILQYCPRKNKIDNKCIFPEDYLILVCMSNIPAEKSGKKRDVFNSRILAYEVGTSLFKRYFPRFANKIDQISDLTPKNLRISNRQLLKMVLKIPNSVQFSELPQLLGNEWESLQNRFQFTEDPLVLNIRDVLIYGIAECSRSVQFLTLIRQNELKLAGNLMLISHNGDRIVQFDENLEQKHYHKSYSQTYIRELLKDAKNRKNSLQFEHLSGRYRCSIKEIDFIVDLCKRSKGVLGAQIAGGGLGGSCIAIVRKDYIQQLKEKIQKNYWEKFHQNCDLYECRSVDGLSIF